MTDKNCARPLSATRHAKEGATPALRIFDTTLRDGEQAPGFSMDRSAKRRMAQMLESLGVDTIEAGFPKASDDDFAAVRDIADMLQQTTVCALARCVHSDIDTAAFALEKARQPRIHVFLSTSPLHREHKLGMSKAQIVDTVSTGVERARMYCEDVEFSAEDAMRTEPEFLAEVFSTAIVAGASTLNVPDTVGYMTPTEIAERFAWLRTHVHAPDDIVFSCHCHNDLGLAVANSLAAIGAGARQVECTINGIGERAGNAALEEIVMALKVRQSRFDTTTRINTHQLYPASRLLSELTCQPLHRNKAIVGENAFAHESGIHQHGMLKHRGTYEIMRPQDVGIASTSLVLGKHSGRSALRQRLASLGHNLDTEALEDMFVRFKALADKKREIYDDDLEALLRSRAPDATTPWRLLHLDSNTHLDTRASASVHLCHADGRELNEVALGDGPVDAAIHAIESATGIHLNLQRFHIQAIGSGSDAQGEARLSAQYAERDWNGYGVSSDIVAAAAQATLTIINRITQSATTTQNVVISTSSDDRNTSRVAQ